MPRRSTPQRTKPNRSVENMSISDGDDTNNFTDEEEEEEEDEEGDESEDRGDHHDPTDGEEDEEDPDEEEESEDDPDEEEEEEDDDEGEDDPDADEEEEEDEDDEGDGLSEDDLRDIASGGMVPIGRLNQVLEQNRQLVEAAASLLSGGKPGGKPKEEAAPFDLAGKLRERNKALIDGEEDRAAEIDLEIENHRIAEAESRATARVSAGLAEQAIKNAVVTVRKTFPVLDPQSKKFNEDTNDSVRGIANVLESKGWSSADAIVEAARRVCDPTGALTDGGGRKAGKPKKAAKAVREKAAAGKDTRTQRERLRDLNRARRTPPNSARAGVPNRNSVDADENDNPEQMTEGRVRRMTEQEKRVARGDFIGQSPRRKQRGR